MTYTCSLRSTNLRSLSDRLVIDPSGVGYEPGVLHGFIRRDGGGGNRTRVPTLWPNHRKGSEPFSGFVRAGGEGL